MKINTDRIGVFLKDTLNPQYYFKPDTDFNIKELFPEAIKAISIYHDGPNIIRVEIPINTLIKLVKSGGSVAVTNNRYNSLEY